MDTEKSAGSGFQASVNYRYFRADRPFSGDQETGNTTTQNINESAFYDFGLTYNFNPRFSATLTLPYSDHTRSSTFPVNKSPTIRRYEMQSSGLGDVRLAWNGWIFNPVEARKWNVLLGMGVSAPTGEKQAKDGRPRQAAPLGAPVPRIVVDSVNVDQSIQPGTGGWGLTMDFFAYRQLGDRWMLFANGSYTVTPEETNGASNSFRNGSPLVDDATFSIADAYLARAGVGFTIWEKLGLSASLAGRLEGVPVEDLVGGSSGFRRPGYAFSVEPGLSIMKGGWSASLSVPVAVLRERSLSLPEEQGGVTKPGEASFADWSILASIGKHF